MRPDPGTADPPRAVERRVLLLPPTQRDAGAIRRVFDASGIDCTTVPSMHALCLGLDEGAAAVVVSEEALAAEPEGLAARLGRQPVWADLPVIVLSRSGSESPKLTGLLDRAGNVSVVERPVRISTFLSIVKAALRGRERQYQVREHLERLLAVEAERTALWESERAARAEAERAGRMKDEFLATLSHEIRTPLNAILGWTHILSRSAPPDAEIAGGLAVIERNAKAQSRIVSDLLDMNRIVNGKVRLDVRRMDLGPVVRAAIDTVTPAADAKGIRVQADLDPAVGPVGGDAERLQQVFWNLLSNAVKFTPRGGSVTVTLLSRGPHAEVRIADTGEGIDAPFLPHVFGRFRQADGSTTRRHGGLGLGLAIVKQLVELHGGSVAAASEGVGSGSTFVVRLPLSYESPRDQAMTRTGVDGERPDGSSAGPVSPGRVAGVRVLVVDDEPDARDLVKRLLEDAGARVSTAGSAAEAFAAVWREPPDVLVSDIGMPGEDGCSLVRRVRSLPPERGGRIAAIALTAYARDEDREGVLKAGFQRHLSKPVDPAGLVAAIAAAASGSSMPPGAAGMSRP